MALARTVGAPRRIGQTTVVVRQGRRRAPTSVRRAGARVGRAAAQLAWDEKHTLFALGTAAVYGYARRHKWNLPKFGSLSPEASGGLALWALGRFTKNKMASHAATGLLSIAAWQHLAMTRETRDQLNTMIRDQPEEDDDEGTEGVSGPFHG